MTGSVGLYARKKLNFNRMLDFSPGRRPRSPLRVGPIAREERETSIVSPDQKVLTM